VDSNEDIDEIDLKRVKKYDERLSSRIGLKAAPDELAIQ